MTHSQLGIHCNRRCASLFVATGLSAVAFLFVPAREALAAPQATTSAGTSSQSKPITGRVIDPEGRPVAAAQVAVLDNRRFTSTTCVRGLMSDGCFEHLTEAGAVRAVAESGSDGGFTIQVPGGLSNADYVWVQGVDAQGRSVRTTWPLAPNRSVSTSTLGDIKTTRRRDFVLLVQGDGRPIENADVDFGNGETHRTDRTGTATHSIYASSESSLYHLAFTVRADGFASDEWVGGQPAGTTTHVMTLFRESILSGRVLDTNGRPIAEASVSATPADPVPGVAIATSHSTAPNETAGTTRTATDGAFSLRGLRGGQRYRLKIVSKDMSVASIERVVTVGSGPLDLVLTPAIPVTLTLTGVPDGPLDRRSELRGQPGPGISLEWLDPVSGSWQEVASPRHVAWHDRDGADLQFDQVPAGSIRVMTMGDFTIAADVSEPLTIAPGAPVVIPIVLARNRELRLQVNDARGQPVPGARVEVFSHTGRSSSYTNTGADGAVTFRVHPAHDVKVTITLAGKPIMTTVVRAGTTPPPIVVPAR